MCLSEEIIMYIIYFLKKDCFSWSWDYEALHEGTVSYTEVSAHTSTVSSQGSAKTPKTWESLFCLFLLLNLLSDGRSAGSRGILKERLLSF